MGDRSCPPSPEPSRPAAQLAAALSLAAPLFSELADDLHRNTPARHHRTGQFATRVEQHLAGHHLAQLVLEPLTVLTDLASQAVHLDDPALVGGRPDELECEHRSPVKVQALHHNGVRLDVMRVDAVAVERGAGGQQRRLLRHRGLDQFLALDLLDLGKLVFGAIAIERARLDVAPKTIGKLVESHLAVTHLGHRQIDARLVALPRHLVLLAVEFNFVRIGVVHRHRVGHLRGVVHAARGRHMPERLQPELLAAQAHRVIARTIERVELGQHAERRELFLLRLFLSGAGRVHLIEQIDADGGFVELQSLLREAHRGWS